MDETLASISKPTEPWLGRTLSLRRVLTGLGPWLLVAVLSSLHVFFFGQDLYRDRAELWRILAFETPIWCLWWPSQVLISRLGRRWRFSSASWFRPLLFHSAASLALTFTLLSAVAAWALQAFPFSIRAESTFLDALRFFGTGIAAIVFCGLYWLLLAFGQARLLLHEIRLRDIRAAQLEASVSKARLRALKMQLRPHFLFNSLNSAVSLVHAQEAKKAVALLHRLSEFLRMTLEDTGEQEIPLRRELAFAERYMRIEKTRFPDRLDYRVEVDSSTFDVAVPNLLLQPLLENAVRHAVGPDGGQGRLEIHAIRDGGRLVLMIRDDGPGAAPASSAQLVVRPRSGNGGSGLGIGLPNVRERLHHLYGSEHSIDLSNSPQGGLEVRIEIPFRRLEEPEVEVEPDPMANDGEDGS